MELENNYTVYMHISPSNKRYIGITCQEVKKRWLNGNGYGNNDYFTKAIKKYGWNNFQHIIIVKGLTKEEAEWLEVELIRELDTTNRDKGYNITEGGKGAKGRIVKKETREKISKANSNPSEETREKMRKNHFDTSYNKHSNARKIICITTNKVFDCRRRGAEYYNVSPQDISKCCNNKINSAGKLNGTPLVWLYYEKYLELSKKEIENRIKKADITGENNPNARKVICITTNKIFDTIREGAKYYGISDVGIVHCCKGKYKSSGKLENGTKLIWRYLDDFLNELLIIEL